MKIFYEGPNGCFIKVFLNLILLFFFKKTNYNAKEYQTNDIITLQ